MIDEYAIIPTVIAMIFRIRAVFDADFEPLMSPASYFCFTCEEKIIPIIPSTKQQNNVVIIDKAK